MPEGNIIAEQLQKEIDELLRFTGSDIFTPIAQVEKFLIFIIQGQFYTIPSRLISEVAVLDKAYPLPLLPDYVKGIINRYSSPYALIDIGLLILKTPTEGSKVVVLKETLDKLAFMIDDVVDIVDVPLAEVLKVEQGSETRDTTEVIESSFAWRHTNVLVLNIREIMNRIKSEFEV
ncbi:MAG: chemotaxis protein CheW [Treponema sp.]|jgi:purine-binding chemotaxis protein CheW|nr:chemotaxis protein CheW [Treponema sp.]